MSLSDDEVDTSNGEIPETELTSFGSVDKDQPFKDFSSISDAHSELNTALPHFYHCNQENGARDEDDDSIPILTVSNHSIDDPELQDVNISIATETLENNTNNTNNNETEEIDMEIDDVPSPAEYRSFSLNNCDVSPLLIRSIDQRFQTRLSSLTSIRSASSNISSTSSFSTNTRDSGSSTPTNRNTVFTLGDEDLLLDEASSSPWETMRWSKLRKISNQIFSESAQLAYGKPTYILAAAHIILGMSHGQVLVFDYHQTLQAVLGPNTKAIECGPVTSLAVSADFSYIASGYSNGHIFTWDLAKPTTPNIHVRPLAKSALLKSKHSDGHVENTPVIYLNFVGKRHSALVSGDVSGLAFSHDTKRSVMGRAVHTRRILGRYPQINPSIPHTKQKPTTLLACSPLPLGSAIQPTDKMCLVAILTPYLLAIVSVLPKPQTEFKTGRPKTVTSETGLSGCLAWLPALKSALPGTPGTNTRLAYSWSNVVTVMEIVPAKNGTLSPSNKTSVSLEFKLVNRFVGNEAIVSIQWLSRQVIALVTSTQRLILLNEHAMAISATVDLLNKHISHTDYFSSTLKDLMLPNPNTQEPQPVVVCDAFFNSVRGFKGKLFLLGNYELVVGSLSNWADRLLDTMQTGDYIGAIDLATSYYLGNQDLAIVALPENDEERKAIVIKNLPEMIVASIKYTFNGTRAVDNSEQTWEDFLQELCDTCLHAWIAIEKPISLLEEIFEQFEKNNYLLLFYASLTPLISNGQVTYLPPAVFRELVKTHASDPNLSNRLEEVICSLDIETLDLDTAITLSKEYHLRDTLIYIWNRALNDYVTPFVEFIEYITKLQGPSNRRASLDALLETEKVYPYISYILSGRVYPTGLPFEDQNIAARARSYIYYFLFSSINIAWPQGGPIISTRPSDRNGNSEHDFEEEPIYPYLTMLLKFNPAAFFAALNEAFEDPFLNEGEDRKLYLQNNHAYNHFHDTGSNGVHEDNVDEALAFGSTVNRQLIVNILLEVFDANQFQDGNFDPYQKWRLGPSERIFLNIFIARNYPKYAQFIMLPGSVLSDIILEICNYAKLEESDTPKTGKPSSSYNLKQECELSLEALFSKYKPYDLDNTISLLREVKFFHVLQFLFRGERKYDELLRVTLKLWQEEEKYRSSSDSTSLPSEYNGILMTVTSLFDVLVESLRKTSYSHSKNPSYDFSSYSSQIHNGSFHSTQPNDTSLSESVCKKQRAAITKTITQNFRTFAMLNANRFVRIIANYCPQLHENVFKLDGLHLEKNDAESSNDEESQDSSLQYKYLDALFGLVASKSGRYALPAQQFRHLYVRLVCKQAQQPSKSNIGNNDNTKTERALLSAIQAKLFRLFKTTLTGPDDVDLNVLRSSLEKCGASDSIVLILRRQNKTVEALKCTIHRLKELNIEGILCVVPSDDNKDDMNDKSNLDEVQIEMNKYLELGIEICNHRDVTLAKNPLSLSINKSQPFASSKRHGRLDSHLGLQTVSEKLWVMLIDSMVEISKDSRERKETKNSQEEGSADETELVSDSVKTLTLQSNTTKNSNTLHSVFVSNLLQKALFSLLDKSTSTASASIKGDDAFDNATIVRICSALLTPIDFDEEEQTDDSSSSHQNNSDSVKSIILQKKKERRNRTIGAVRPLLTDLFSAYRYQTRVLEVAKKVLDKDAYEALCELQDVRLRGWKVALAGSYGISNSSPGSTGTAGGNGNGGECEGCGKPIAGLGVDANRIYELWETKKRQTFGKSALENVYGTGNGAISSGSGKSMFDNKSFNQKERMNRMIAKGKLNMHEMNAVLGRGMISSSVDLSAPISEIVKGQQKNENGEILVVFKCGHIYHLKCLRNLGVKGELKCVIDGT